MDELLKVNNKKDAMHFMIRAAFIEIRASNSLEEARKIANLFHILPVALLKCSTPDDYDAQFLSLFKRAERLNLSDYLMELRSAAMRAADR